MSYFTVMVGFFGFVSEALWVGNKERKQCLFIKEFTLYAKKREQKKRRKRKEIKKSLQKRIEALCISKDE